MTRRGVAGVRLCHADPCKYPAGKCPLHGLPRVGFCSMGVSRGGDGVGSEFDRKCATCGFNFCSCQVIDAEFSEAEPEPPKDVLPEGWTNVAGYAQGMVIRHVSGVTVSSSWSGEFWYWARPGTADYRDVYTSRELAMAAALQSVKPKKASPHQRWMENCGGQTMDSPPCGGCERCMELTYPGQPAEPALRPGWHWNEGDKRWDHKGIDATVYQSKARAWVAIAWGGRVEPGHPTLEAAQLRAEAIARGEP